MRVVHVEDPLKTPQQEWVIKGILPKQHVTIVQGKEGIGKTFLLLDWALCCACGKPWINHAATQGHVVYVAAFGLNRIGPRLRAWVKHQQQNREVLHSLSFVDIETFLFESETTQRLMNTLHASPTPSLVILDIQDDQKKSVFHAARRILDEFGSSVVMVSYEGYPTFQVVQLTPFTRSVRGEKSINGFTATFPESVGSGRTKTISLRLQEVPVQDDLDPTGDLTTSCILSEMSS